MDRQKIKPGGKIKTVGGHEYYYDRSIVDALGQTLMLCRLVKKDGTASRAVHLIHPSDVES